MRTPKSKTILVIETDDVHRIHIDSYNKKSSGVTVVVKEDSRSAIAYLQAIQQDALALPGLLLVNYKILLEESQLLFDELKKRKLRAYIPVIALSDTDEKEIIDELYDYGVASCLLKPTETNEWHSLLGLLVHYWFNEVSLPNYSLARHG